MQRQHYQQQLILRKSLLLLMIRAVQMRQDLQQHYL
jgi:hypothetical protein